MARWQKIAILVLIVIALVFLGRIAVQRFLGGDTEAAPMVEQNEFVPVTRGTILTTVNASGNIVYPDQVDLAFSVTGDLEELAVAVGDAVAEGDPLAYLDDTELQDAVRREQTNLRTAELNLEKLLAPAATEDVRKAELALLEAETRLADVEQGPTQHEINQAEANVKSAQVAYDEAVKSLENLRNPGPSAVQAAQNKVANAESAFAQAQAAVQALEAGGSEATLLAAENALNMARNRVETEKVRVRTDIAAFESELKEAREHWERAERRVQEDDSDDNRRERDSALRNYNEVRERVEPEISIRQAELSDSPPPGTKVGELTAAVRKAELDLESAEVSAKEDVDSARRRVQIDEQSLEIARRELHDLRNPTQEDLTTAEQQVESKRLSLENAQETLADLQAGPDQDELAGARNDVERARLDLQRVQTGANAQDVELQEIQVERAQLNLEKAQRNLADAVLRAPFTGLVAAVEGSVGQTAGNKVVTLVRADRIEMRANVDESDVATIQVGQKAEVTTYASPDVIIAGTVETISPTSIDEQGVVLYPITIRLDPGEQSLRGGLSANATVEVSSRDNVLLVPTRAIRREENERVVYVRLAGDELERRVVEIGVRDSDVTEIISGVSEGEEVAIPVRAGGTLGGGGIDVRTR